MPEPTPSDWQMDFGEDGSYPFVEDEDANITGLGHQDPQEFADAVNRYDRTVGGYDGNETWGPEDISHGWAVPYERDYEQYLRAVAAPEPGAIAITTLWGQR